MKKNQMIFSNLCILGTIIIALMGLFGYIPGMEVLGKISKNYIPMAPSTAISFIIISLILMLINIRQRSKLTKTILLLGTLIVLLFGILEVIGYFMEMDLNFEDRLFPTLGTLNGVPIARMSPATGASFLLSGAVVFMQILQKEFPGHNLILRYIGSILASLLFIITVIFCLAYVYNSPLLYNQGTTIPMALTTALGFLLLSISLLLSEKEFYLLKIMTKNSTRGYLLRYILPLSMSTVLMTGIAITITQQMEKINPAFVSAALLVLFALLTGVVTTWITHHIGNEIDISKAAEKQAAKVLKEKEKYLRTLLNSIGDAVIAVDIDGKVTQMNPVAQRLTGWKLDESKGKPITEIFSLINAISRKTVKNPVLEALATGKIINLTNHTILIAKNGKEYQIADSAAPIINSGGETIGSVLVFRDITEEYFIQEELQNMQKLKSIGSLAGGIAHDFNNILGGLFGFIEMANEINQDTVVNDYLLQALSAFGRAKDLTQQLLTFSQGGHPRLQTISIEEILIKNTLFHLSGSATACEFSIDKELWYCDIDENQIGQVIDNLIINAQQAMPSGGNILVSAENSVISTSHITSLPSGNYIHIAITDSGRGINPNILKRIFDPFFTTKETGKGLGLATCYSIMQKHKGSITIESKVDKGSTFHLYLPQSEKSAVTDLNLEQIQKAHSGTGYILIMDDDESIITLAITMFNQMGYDVLTAATGTEALSLCEKSVKKRTLIKAALLDLTIPGDKGGKEIVTRLKEIFPEMVIVAMSGYSNDPIIAEPKAHGFSDSIQKPFRIKDLNILMNKHMTK